MIDSRHGTRHSLARLAALLGVVAVLVRAVIAPGLMPDPVAAAHGVFQLVICTGDGLKVLHGGAGGPQAPDHHGDPGLCPYSAAGHVAVAADLVSPPIADFRLVIEVAPWRDVLPAARPGTVSARAPPRIA